MAGLDHIDVAEKYRPEIYRSRGASVRENWLGGKVVLGNPLQRFPNTVEVTFFHIRNSANIRKQ